jgi:hypothetical protein
MLPWMTISASVSPVSSSAAASRSGYFPAVLELEAVDRHDFRADFETPFRIQQLLDSLACVDATVMAALRTNSEIFFEVGAIEHRLARRAFDPQAFGHRRLLDARRRIDARRQQLLQPAHRRPRVARWPVAVSNGVLRATMLRAC